MTTPIDYSRPVGWWCPVDDYEIDPANEDPCDRCIPVYLPIPEGQRPLVEDEVEDAEVVTLNVSDLACYASGWRSTFTEAVDEINYIVTGATE